MTPDRQARMPTPQPPPERPLPPSPPERPLPPQRPEIRPRPMEQRGAVEMIAAGAAVVSALPAAVQVGGQIKDKLTKK